MSSPLTAIPPERLLAIIEMQNAILGARSDPGGVMHVVAARAERLTGATGAVVELVEGDELVYRAATGTLASYASLRIPRRGSLSSRCLVDGVTLSSPDTSCDTRVDRAACRRVGAASMVCVPLLHAGEAVGVLKVISDRVGAFDAIAVGVLSLLAEVIAASMHHAREHDDAVEPSLHDGLTGLYNRRAFDQRLAQEIARSARYGHALSVARFELDGLALANDTLGHAHGDRIVRDAAIALRGALRSHDACFRLGGDAFAALLPETAVAGAARAAARCADAVSGAALWGGRVGVSAGIAELRAGESIAELVARAELALDEHKHSKRRASDLGRASMLSTAGAHA